MKQERAFFEQMTNSISPGWPVKLQAHLRPGQMDLGHRLYLAYRGHDASTICRPVFFSARESGFCTPEVLTQMARQVIAHDLRPGTSVADQLRRAGGAIIAPGYRA